MTDVFDLSWLFRSSDFNTRKGGVQLTAPVISPIWRYLVPELLTSMAPVHKEKFKN